MIWWLLPGIYLLGSHVLRTSAGDEREGRGLEDTGIGYCHTQGMGWNKELTAEQVVQFGLQGSRDSSGDLSSPNTEDFVDIFWSRLVQHPKCVDKLDITLGSGVQVNLMDPADSEDSREKIKVPRKICETENLKIKMHNKRGGFNANVDVGLNLQLVQRKPDENFEWEAVLEGILANPAKFMNDDTKLRTLNTTVNTTGLHHHTSLLVWNEDLFKEPFMKKCLTSAEVVDGNNGNVTKLDINSTSFAVEKVFCFTVNYKYQGETFANRSISSSKSNCRKSKPKPTAIEDKVVDQNYEDEKILKFNKTEGTPPPEQELKDEENTTGLASLHIVIVVLLVVVSLSAAIALVLYKKKCFSKQGGYQLDIASGGEESINEGSVNFNQAMENEDDNIVNFSIDGNEGQAISNDVG